MNKPVIKNFAVWARNKLIADITYKAGLLGITDKMVKPALPQSTKDLQFFDIGSREPYRIMGAAIEQRKHLANKINERAKQGDYATAYKTVIEQVAYTWFNRLIAVRFMEVNDYLPSHVRVLSSATGKAEPDIVTTPFEAGLEFTQMERDNIITCQTNNKLDELFRMLFIKQCNALNAILPELFERIGDYTELLLSISFTDNDGVVWHLINDISEGDFKEAVEIIGWMYQYYNTELNEVVYDGNLSKTRVSKELLPAATTIYTPDWAIRYMVENSLGRLWMEGHPSDTLKSGWKYYLDEAEQTPEVQVKLEQIRVELRKISPEDISFIDPCMGSGHILVYAFEVLMQIYSSAGYSGRDASKLILEKNLYGLDIDHRAYQLAYFALMMKARQYNRRIFNESISPQVYHPVGWNDGEECGSAIIIDDPGKRPVQQEGQLDIFNGDYERDLRIWNFKRLLSQKYDVVVTNPPYLGSNRFSPKLTDYVVANYNDVKSDLSMVMYKHALDHFSKMKGFVAFITTSSWMFLSSFEKLRNHVISKSDFDSLVDFGTELFDGKVGHNPIVSWVTRNTKTHKNMIAVRLVEFCYSRRDEKESEFYNPSNRHTANSDNFVKIPGSPVAYWVSEKVFKLYSSKLIIDLSKPCKGIDTGNNERFLRLWFEVVDEKVFFPNGETVGEKQLYKQKWFPYNKGGNYRKWYGNNEYTLDFANNGRELRAFPGSNLRNKNYYFQKGITWSTVTSGKLSLRYFDYGFLFDNGGCCLYSADRLLYICGLLNTCVSKFLLGISPTLNFQPGDIGRVPCIVERKQEVEFYVAANISLSREDWDSFETSWDFKRHPLTISYGVNTNGDFCKIPQLTEMLSPLKNQSEHWKRFTDEQFAALKTNEEELNRIFIDIYDLQDELTPEVEDRDVTVHRIFNTKDDVPESMRGNAYILTKADVIKSLISYAVGCMFGRYSLDVDGLAYAGGEWDAGKYSSFIPDRDNIIPITDEEYLPDDIVTRFVDFIRTVYGADTLEENLRFIAEALGGRGSAREVIRSYFLKDFFKNHTKIYQKRPIYWLFDSGKADGFKALIYLHRYDQDTVGKLRIDYLHKLQRVYESEIIRMRETIEKSGDARVVAAAQKRLEKLVKQLKETKEYDEKIAHLALARIALDLDDGVKVNYEKLQTGTDGKKYEVLGKI